jgi:MFS family permease
MSAVIDQWFAKKAGLAIGAAWAVNSVYMLIMSPVMISVIESVGWRMGYIVLAVVSAILVIPSTVFVIRYKPADKGMLPFGYEATAALKAVSEPVLSGVPFREAVKSPAFMLCVLFLSVVQLTVCMNQLFPTYAAEVGFDPIIGGYMVSAASLADIFLNIVVGSSCDKFGSEKALVAWICVSIVSFLMLIFSVGNPGLAIIAAGVNDVMYVVAGTGLTCLIIELFGSKDFGRIFSWICAIGYIVGAFGMPLMTGVYSATGSFQFVFGFCIVLNILIAILLVLAKRFSLKLKWDGVENA